MLIKRFSKVLMSVYLVQMVTSCGTDSQYSNGAKLSQSQSADAIPKNPADGNLPGVNQNQGGTVGTNGSSNQGTLGDLAKEATTVRLLKPEELNAKTTQIFGSPWMVPGGMPGQTTNGFELYSSNLNGIDYNNVNTYSKVGSAVYISTQSKFCNQMSTEAFADVNRRRTFFMAATEADTLATNRAAVVSNLQDLTVRMFGKELNATSPVFATILSLYGDLERAAAADRGNKHPLELTTMALCFSTEFVHTL